MTPERLYERAQSRLSVARLWVRRKNLQAARSNLTRALMYIDDLEGQVLPTVIDELRAEHAEILKQVAS